MEYISNILLEISNENLEKTEKLIQETENYGAKSLFIVMNSKENISLKQLERSKGSLRVRHD